MRLQTNFADPVMRKLFNAAFSAFRDLDRDRRRMLKEGIKRILSAAGTELNFGFRPRRFSGGPGLPRSRYFTLCDADSFNDHGTLRDEMTAYYSGVSGIAATIFDPNIDEGVLDYLRNRWNLDEVSLSYPLYFVTYEVLRRTPKNRAIIDGKTVVLGEKTGATYGVRQTRVEIEGVVDLRDPDTQDWFTRTFVALELQGRKLVAEKHRIHFLNVKPMEEQIKSFGDLLSVILSLNPGGGISFTQAIGLWMRRHRVNALIFPSARSNPVCQIEGGRPVSWKGWNLVLYAGAKECGTEDLFGWMSVWRDPDHDHFRVSYKADGLDRGSFKVRGAREFNLVNS